MTVLLLLAADPVPKYVWSEFRLPREIVSRPLTIERMLRNKARTRTIRFDLTHDGSTWIAVTELGAVCYWGDQLKHAWTVRFEVPSVYDVSLVDKRHAYISTGREIIRLSLEQGKVENRVACPQLNAFAALPSGYLAGPVRLPGKSFLTNVLISPENGEVFAECIAGKVQQFECGVLPANVVIANRSGTFFAGGGGVCNSWIADVYTQRTRLLTAPTEPAGFTALCFDPTGRYVAAGYRDCEIMILDLSQSGRATPEAIRKSANYVGRFGAEGQPKHWPPEVCRGIGFIRDQWLWFTNDSKLYVCKWPNPKIVAKFAIPESPFNDSRWWKGSLDGRVLIGIEPQGAVTIGRLREE